MIYIIKYKPKKYLFEYRKKNMSSRAIEKIVKKIGYIINKNIVPNDLRYLFAKRLAKQKINLATIQYLLGHKNKRTTEELISS